MLNKNVCPKCGQLYDLGLAACPVCNTPAQVPAEAESSVQRRRLTEVERRQRQQDQKRAAAEERRRERDQRRAADAEEERLLEEEEDRLWRERRKKKLEKRGMSEDEIARKLENAEEQPPRARRENNAVPDGRDPARTPAVFSVVSILLLLLALAIGGCYLLWQYHVVDVPFLDRLSGSAPLAQQQTGEVCTALELGEQTVELTSAGQSFALTYTRQPDGCTQPVTFRTSDESVAMVGELGIITAVGPGTATVTAVCGDITASCTVNCTFETAATEAPVQIDPSEGILLDNVDITFLAVGENTYLTVTNLPEGASVFWKSSNPDVATVDEKGHVVAVGRGTCYITAVVEDYTASCIVRCNFEE